MKLIITITALLVCQFVSAQTVADSVFVGTATVIKDSRLDVLAEKYLIAQTAVKVVKYGNGLTAAKGYRLMVINTADRNLAMNIRSKLYQLFPDQKQYMSFQMPNNKIKMGNYLDKSDAERAKKQIMAMKLVPNNVYVVQEMIEVKQSLLEEEEK